MQLFKDILAKILERGEVVVTFPNLTLSAAEIVELEAYRALQEIKAVIEDHTLDDTECFEQIEEIVCIFERMGSGGGSRHDFN